jgi:hypothetical protein
MALGIKNTTPAQQGKLLGRVVEWPWALLALWLVASVLFLGRALAGRFERPLPMLVLLAVAAVIALITVAVRLLLRGSWVNSVILPRTTPDWLAQFMPSLAAIILAVGFTVAGAPPTGLVFLWIIVAAEIFFGAAGPWTWPLLQRRRWRAKEDRGAVVPERPRGTLNDSPTVPAAHETNSTSVTDRVSSGHDSDSGAQEEPNDELPWLWHEATALQELRYMSLPEQGICVAGSQRVTIPAAQQTSVVHTVFYPPFSDVPEISIELQEPYTVTIKPAQILPQGVRWEIRAEQTSDQPREVQWAFSAVCAKDPRG